MPHDLAESHPRPQLARERCTDLGGPWGFAYDDADVGLRQGWPERSDVFAGLQFVLTGTLETMSREEAKAAIESRGGRVTSAVSKKTSYVVYGRDPGAKLDKAKELGVETRDEEGFRRLLDEGTPG